MLGKLISSAKGNVQPFGTLELVNAKIFCKKRKRLFNQFTMFSDQIVLYRNKTMFVGKFVCVLFFLIFNHFQSIILSSEVGILQ